MCGKFSQMFSWGDITRYEKLAAGIDATFGNDSVVTYTPMRAVPVVHMLQGSRKVSPMVWGFTDRKATGHRVPRHMHARGETVHQLPTFRECFRRRRGVTWIRTFNEGMEHLLSFDDGTPAGKSWTQQWTLRRKDGTPTIIAVIYDEFDIGRGLEREFVQVTVEANAMVSQITDRMPLMLDPHEVSIWLGEDHNFSEEDVRALIRTREFDPALWEMQVEDPSKKPPRPRKPKA